MVVVVAAAAASILAAPFTFNSLPLVEVGTEVLLDRERTVELEDDEFRRLSSERVVLDQTGFEINVLFKFEVVWAGILVEFLEVEWSGLPLDTTPDDHDKMLVVLEGMGEAQTDDDLTTEE